MAGVRPGFFYANNTESETTVLDARTKAVRRSKAGTVDDQILQLEAVARDVPQVPR